MPRKPIKYENTLIYKLICDKDPNFLYLGHTTAYTKRKNKHKDNSKDKGKTGRYNVYKHIQKPRTIKHDIRSS